jgi:uncharacterized protein with ACT and thioredoxin-like domain
MEYEEYEEYNEENMNQMFLNYMLNNGTLQEFIDNLGVKTYKKEYKEEFYKRIEYQNDIERLTADNKKLNKKLNQINNSKAYKVLRWFEKLFNYRVVVINLEDDNL